MNLDFLKLNFSTHDAYYDQFNKNLKSLFTQLNNLSIVVCISKTLVVHFAAVYNHQIDGGLLANLCGVLISIITMLALKFDKINLAIYVSFAGVPLIMIAIGYFEHSHFVYAFPMMYTIAAFLILYDRHVIILNFILTFICLYLQEYFKSIHNPSFNPISVVFNFILFASGYYLVLAYIRSEYLKNSNQLYKKQVELHDLKMKNLVEESEKQILELELKSKLIKTDEQKKLGLELHSALAGDVAALKNKIEFLSLNSNDENKKQYIQDLLELVSDIYQHVRNKSHDLYRGDEDNNTSVTQQINYIIERGLPKNVYKIEVYVEESLLEFKSLSFKIALLKIIRECLINISKHAHANHIEILLVEENSNMVLYIRDNGKGFEYNTNREGIGLKTISNLSTEFDGILHIESNERGTMISITFAL